ncbi:MAG: ABC transporter permease [Longimicrobiales bacterium]|nr:ABC transporter permease [Longimicrobiales bacterium]
MGLLTYRLLLRLLPKAFRARNATEMQEVAEALLAERSGWARVTTLIGLYVDVLAASVTERIARRRRSRLARSESGGPRRLRGSGLRGLISGVLQDVRFSIRALRRRVGFATVTTLVLALGIGATTTIFTIVNGVLLEPLPYESPEEIGILWHAFGEHTGQDLPLVNPQDVWDYRAWSTELADLTYGSGREWVVGERQDVRIMHVGRVEAGFFEFFGYAAALGRTILPSDDLPESPPVAVLSHPTWVDRFGGDPSVMGRFIKIRGEEHRIIGILPREFRIDLPSESRFLGNAEIWIPARVDPDYDGTRLYTIYTAFARLAPDATFASAQDELDEMTRRIRRTDPGLAELRARIVPLKDDVVKAVEPLLLLLFAAVGLMLVVACANAANLLLGRGHTRGWELAMRTALGAGRRRVFFLVLTESLLLAGAAGVLGAASAVVGIRVVGLLGADSLPLTHAISFDGDVFLFTIGVSLLAAILAGLVPAARATPGHSAAVLAGSRGSGPDRGSARLRSALVVMEVVITVVLLVGAGLLMRSFRATQSVDPGYATSGSMTFRLALSPEVFPDGQARRSYFMDLRRQLESLPQVRSVAAVSQLPLAGQGYQGDYAVDEETRRNWGSLSSDGRWISPGYFETMGATLLAGREFVPADLADDRRVIIIDDRLAELAFPGVPLTSVVGRRIQTSRSISPEPRHFHEVVGVVRHMNLHSLTEPGLEQMYAPLSFSGWFRGGDHFSVVVRSEGRLDGLARALRGEVPATGPGVALQDLEPFSDAVARASASARISFVLMVLFGATALALATIGLYGVLGYTVRQRTKEIGIRIALGQDRDEVRALVMRQGLRLVAFSTLAGLVAAALVADRASFILYGVSPIDPLTYVLATFGLVVTAVAACWLPARRAMRVQPVQALSVE